MSATPHVEYGNQSRDWVGDNPLVLLDVAKAKNHGWEPRRGIRESIEDTVNWIVANDWVLGLADR